MYFLSSGVLSPTTCFEEENIVRPAWKSSLISRQQMSAVFHSDLVSVSCWIHRSEARLLSTVQLSQAFWNWLCLALWKMDSGSKWPASEPSGFNRLRSTHSITAPHFSRTESLVLCWVFIIIREFLLFPFEKRQSIIISGQTICSPLLLKTCCERGTCCMTQTCWCFDFDSSPDACNSKTI